MNSKLENSNHPISNSDELNRLKDQMRTNDDKAYHDGVSGRSLAEKNGFISVESAEKAVVISL